MGCCRSERRHGYTHGHSNTASDRALGESIPQGTKSARKVVNKIVAVGQAGSNRSQFNEKTACANAETGGEHIDRFFEDARSTPLYGTSWQSILQRPRKPYSGMSTTATSPRALWYFFSQSPRRSAACGGKHGRCKRPPEGKRSRPATAYLKKSLLAAP